MAIVAIVFSSNCSRVEQNNDPIIGIWVEAVSNINTDTSKNNARGEWIFNDVYLGRYHEISEGKILLKTDFSWSKKDGVYTIMYNGLVNKPNDVVTIKDSSTGTLLRQTDGNLLAIRE